MALVTFPMARSPISDAPAAASWWLEAACLGHDTELWFNVTERGDWGTRRFVKSVCSECPVIEECLASALREEEGQPRDYRHGVRGGLDPLERYRYHRRRR